MSKNKRTFMSKRVKTQHYVKFMFIIISIVIFFIITTYIITFFVRRNTINKYQNLASRVLESRVIQDKSLLAINEFKDSLKVVHCYPSDNLQKKINEGAGGIILLEPGIHRSYKTSIPSNTRLIVPENAIIKLADDYTLDQSKYGDAVGDAVLQCWGTKEEPIENVIIQLDGVIDGNKVIHPYNKGGVEGIDWKWVKNSCIIGNGIIRDANGDGIDLDVVYQCYFEGIRLLNNDGGGIHFGSPRPIRPSIGNLVFNCYSIGNGFYHKRSGFDHSWPNVNGVTYMFCEAQDNYQNYQIEGSGAIIISCKSINLGKVEIEDEVDQTLYSEINDNINVPEEIVKNNLKGWMVNSNYDLPKDNLWNKSVASVDSTLNQIIINYSGYYLITSNTNDSKRSILEDSLSIGLFLNNQLIQIGKPLSSNCSDHYVFTTQYLYKNDIVDVRIKSHCEINRNVSEMIVSTNLKAIQICSYDEIVPNSYEMDILYYRLKTTLNGYIYYIYKNVKSIIGNE
jgi:hypothetical protein